jgi:hypothetical protein
MLDVATLHLLPKNGIDARHREGAFPGGQVIRCMVLDVLKLVGRVIGIRRSGKLPDGTNDVKTEQLDYHTSQR